MGEITAAALIPAKPVPSPAPIPAKKHTKIRNHADILQTSQALADIIVYLRKQPQNRFHLIGGNPLEQQTEKSVLTGSPLLDGRQSLVCQLEMDGPAVIRVGPALQKPQLHQAVHPLGHVGLCQPPETANALGRVMLRIVVQKEQHVYLQLRQAVTLQQGVQLPLVEGLCVLDAQ